VSAAEQTKRAPPPEKRGIVAASVYAAGKRIGDIKIEEAADYAKRPGHVVWIGLFEPELSLLQQLQTQFGLHPLAIEDASKAHQHPKVEQYGDSLFIVARTAQLVKKQVAFGETHLFVGQGYVVSVRHGASSSYTAVRERSESCPALLAHGEDHILYAILDFIVDNYAIVTGTLTKEVDSIEESVFRATNPRSDVRSMFRLRQDLLRLRKAAAPLAEVCRRLEHAEVKPIDAAMQPLFRDVSDHVTRVLEEIDSMREVLAFAFEASVMLGQRQQTEITRRLAAWAAILAVPTAIAGIYGMNFENMPETKWAYGYFVVLGGTITICLTLYWRLRRNGWL
jgi:magnesium transporter